MSLVTKVKVGNITNLSEARYCAGMGVDFLGFPSDNSKLALETFREITAWVSVPQFVLELEDRSYTDKEIDLLLSDYDVHCVECKSIHLTALAALTKLPAKPSILPAINTDEWHSVSEVINNFGDQVVAIRILPSSPVNWTVINIISQRYLVLVDVEKIDDVLMHSTVNVGVSLSGTEEIKPGLKRYEHLADVLERLEAE